MPQLPRYESNRQLTGGGLSAGGGPSASNIAAAGQAVSGVLRQRGEQLSQQYDTANAISAFNALREKSREKIQDLMSRESIAAQGVQQDYSKWYPEAYNETAGNFIKNDVQARVFQELAERRREADLDQLASHELTQHRAHRKEALDGMASLTDDDVRAETRAAFTNAFDDPSVKYMAVDKIINDFADTYNAANPFHDNTQAIETYKRAFRIAQMEELIYLDAKSAKPVVEHYKDDLDDAYVKLMEKLSVEDKKQVRDTAYTYLTRKFPDSPDAAINALYDEKVMKQLGLEVDDRDFLANTFKGEINWARDRRKQFQSDSAEKERVDIQKMYQAGDMVGIRKILASSKNLTAYDQYSINNMVETRESKFDDPDKISTIREGIRKKEITRPSQIGIFKNKGVSDATERQLQAELKEQTDNPDRLRYIDDAFDWYDAEFEGNTTMESFKPFARTWLMKQVQEGQIKDEDIIETLRKYVQTTDQLYKEGFLGFFGIGEQKTTAPAGEAIDRLRNERESFSTGEITKPIGPTLPETKTQYIDIPPQIRADIVKSLRDAGKSTDEKYIRQVYQQNKAHFGRKITDK